MNLAESMEPCTRTWCPSWAHKQMDHSSDCRPIIPQTSTCRCHSSTHNTYTIKSIKKKWVKEKVVLPRRTKLPLHKTPILPEPESLKRTKKVGPTPREEWKRENKDKKKKRGTFMSGKWMITELQLEKQKMSHEWQLCLFRISPPPVSWNHHSSLSLIAFNSHS